MKKSTYLSTHVWAVALLTAVQIMTHAAACYFDDVRGCADPAQPGQSITTATAGFLSIGGTNSCDFDTNYVGYCTQATGVDSYQTNQPNPEAKGSTHLTYAASCCEFSCEYMTTNNVLETASCIIFGYGNPSGKPEHDCPPPGNG